MRESLAILLLAASAAAAAPPLPEESFPAPAERGFLPAPPGPEDEMTPAQRERIWAAIDANRARLALPKAGARPALRWPLRTARGYSQPGSQRIANYVDHDPAFPGHVRDYNCGQRSYDRDNGYNHQGIDISLWPDNWNTMLAGQVEVVAAAPGTIVFKADGNDDRSCRFGSQPWNAVYVQHEDGSVAWYGHLRNGSVTAKGVGDRVAAGESLGTVGSSGNSTGPHLHLEVYDAGRQLVDPYAGACNARNAESWWAEQPAYIVPRVNRAFTASAAPVFGTCGADGRMATTGTLSEKPAFAPGETAYFVAAVRDIQAGQAVNLTIRQPDGAVWRQAAMQRATEYFSGALFWHVYALEPTAPPGTWMLEMELAGSQAHVPFQVAAGGVAPPDYTDLWWNPAEPGWGLNVNQQGETLFATWFTYALDGRGQWLVASELRRQADGSFSGALYRTTGVPLARIDGQPAANFPPTPVGLASLRFAQPSRGTFTYTLDNVHQSRSIQRQSFSTATTCMPTRGDRLDATNYQDLWWRPSEPGWGLNVAHQGDTLFATWFTYGDDGRGQWLVASDMRRQPTGEYRGRLYRTHGVHFAAIAGAATSAPPADVGEATLSFADGENGRLDYVVDGVAQSKAIQRQVFGSTRPLCR